MDEAREAVGLGAEGGEENINAKNEDTPGGAAQTGSPYKFTSGLENGSRVVLTRPYRKTDAKRHDAWRRSAGQSRIGDETAS